MNYKVITAVLATILLTVIALAGLGYYMDSNAQVYGDDQQIPASKIETDIPKPNSVLDTLAPEYKQIFVQECNLDGTMATYCQCAFDYMDERLTNDQFIDMAIESQNTDVLPDIMYDAIANCL
jgi:hypothetical protein